MGKTKDISKKSVPQAGKEPSKNENTRAASGEQHRAPGRTAAKALAAIAVGVGGILSLARRRAHTNEPAPQPDAPSQPYTPTEERNVSGADAVPRPAPTRVPVQSASPNTFDHDAIALRAYFLSQERRAAGMPDDPRRDWLDAERALQGENSIPSVA